LYPLEAQSSLRAPVLTAELMFEGRPPSPTDDAAINTAPAAREPLLRSVRPAVAPAAVLRISDFPPNPWRDATEGPRPLIEVSRCALRRATPRAPR
jgi:hypothetical protein